MRFACRIPGALLLVAGLAGPGVARGERSVCINEVCYDPAGQDAGREFVELYNPGGRPVVLEGWWLEAGNGAAPGDWRVQWVGQPGDQIAAGGFFLIADQEVAIPVGPPVARARLQLQNGPDAVRLCRAAGTVDGVGWGGHHYPEYYEGAPAADVPAGQVLARVPDGVDTDGNAGDLIARARATPGGPNAPPGALWIATLDCEPPILRVGTAGRLVATLINESLEPIPLAAITCRLTAPALRLQPEARPAGALEPGAQIPIAWTIDAPQSAPHATLRLAVSIPEGPADSCRLTVQIGHGPVLITELQYDPVAGEGEWVELWNAGETACELAGWQLQDRSGQATVLAAAGSRLAPGGVAVVASDPAALRRHYPDLPSACLLARHGSWPSLNNRVDPAWGFADQIELRNSECLLVDYVRYVPGDLDGDGITLERWVAHGELVAPQTLLPCSREEGTSPGRLPDDLPAGETSATRGALVPQPFFPDRPAVSRHCTIALPAPPFSGTRVTAEIFSLDGRRVAALAVGARVSGPMLLAWDGRGVAGRRLPTGLYLLRALWHETASGTEQRLVRPLVLVRG